MQQNADNECHVSRKESDAKFLKHARLILGLSRAEAGRILGISQSSIKRYENGVIPLSQEKLRFYLEGYGITLKEFLDLKAGKETHFSKPEVIQKPRIIENNKLRRSYKKIITNDVRAIVRLRKIRRVSQYEASQICGWYKSTIGHIEQGRIELTETKIRHIVSSLGFTMKQFNEFKSAKADRENIEDNCISLLQRLDDVKLQSIQSMLKNFA